MDADDHSLPGRGITCNVARQTLSTNVCRCRLAPSAVERYQTSMKQGTKDRAAASLRAWLNTYAGADPSLDHWGAASTMFHQWSTSAEQQEKAHPGPGAGRVQAVCRALTELCFWQVRADEEALVRRYAQCAKVVGAAFDEYKDLAESAKKKQEAYAQIARMYGPRANAAAANVFAFGPPQAFEKLESAWMDLQKLAADAQTVTGYQARRGAPDNWSFAAATQHLHAGGFRDKEIVELLPDGLPSTPLKEATKRVRNRLEGEDHRTLVN